MLEVVALIYIGWFGSTIGSGWLSFFSAAGLVVLIALLWGVFNVPNDPSRSGKAPIPVPGIIRLALEICIFLFATFAIVEISGGWFAIIFASVLIAHYIHTKDRVLWLLKQ